MPSPEETELAALMAEYKKERAAFLAVLIENGVPSLVADRLTLVQMKLRGEEMGLFMRAK